MNQIHFHTGNIGVFHHGLLFQPGLLLNFRHFSTMGYYSAMGYYKGVHSSHKTPETVCSREYIGRAYLSFR